MGEIAEESRGGGGAELQDDAGDALRTVAAGFVATALMVVLLAVVQAAYPGEFGVFRTLAEFAVGTADLWVGVVLFFVGGTLVWPLLFVSLGTYLPGATRVRQGVVFGAVVWVGFVVALARQLEGADLAAFLALSLILHAVYGYVLGALSARLTGKRRIAGPAV